MTATANPSFGDMLSVSDIIDTLRAQDRVVDFEIGAEERRKTLIQSVKEQKAKEGVQVSDDVITAAVDRLEQQRFTFVPMKSGVNRTLATLYVRRARYLRNTAIAVGVVALGTVGYNVGYDQFVTKPRAVVVAREAAAKEAAARKLETDLAVRLPSELKAAVASASVAADRMSETQAKTDIESRNTVALGAIAARNVAAAEQAIRQIGGIEEMLRLAEARAKAIDAELRILPSQVDAAYASALAVAQTDAVAKAKIESVKAEALGAISARDPAAARRAISAMGEIVQELRAIQLKKQLVAEADKFVGNAKAELNRYVTSGNTLDAGAQDALNRRLELVTQAAGDGDALEMKEAMTSYANLVTYAQNEAKLRIVNRRGVRAGVERDYTHWYLVVEALVGGKPVPVEIGNKEEGISEAVPYWGIRVTKRQYDRVLADYSDDKIIDKDKAGTKPKGSLDVRWSLDTIDNQTITRW